MIQKRKELFERNFKLRSALSNFITRLLSLQSLTIKGYFEDDCQSSSDLKTLIPKMYESLNEFILTYEENKKIYDSLLGVTVILK